MCGRYSFVPNKEAMKEQFKDLELPAQLEMSFNIAPTQSAYILVKQSNLKMVRYQWGLVPSWRRNKMTNVGPLTNARSETVFETASFRKSIGRRRCLVPADSFYEWKKETKTDRQPYRIKLRNNKLMVFAGLWDCCKTEQGDLYSFTILTTQANEEIDWLHHRMPVILPDVAIQEKWLQEDLSEDDMRNMMVPLAPGETLEIYPVSKKLNKSDAENNAALQQRVTLSPTLFDMDNS